MLQFAVGGTARGTLPALVAPGDGITPTTPSALTCLVIKNGTDTADSVTITAVGGGRTGVYKWSYDPAAEVEFDQWSLAFTLTIGGLPYYCTIDIIARVAERGTNGANTVAPDNATIGAAAASAASADTKLTAAQLSRIDRFPDINAGAAGGVAIVGSAMSLDSTTLTALFADADVAALVVSITAALVAQIDATDDIPVIAIGTKAAELTLAAILADGSILTLLQDASDASGAAIAAQAAAESADTKLTAGRLGKLDSLTFTVPGKVDASAELTAAALREAIGMADPDLDDQLDAILAASGGGPGGLADWTEDEREQIRYRLGLNGTATAPTEPTPTPIVITPGTDNLTTAWLVIRVAGVATAGITIRYQQAQEPDDDSGSSYDSTIYDVQSDDNGLAEMPMVRGGFYYVWRGAVKRPASTPLITVPADAGSTYELPSHIGA